MKLMSGNQLASFAPLPKQFKFVADGQEYSERLFMANNQGGKSYIGAFESAYHLTGRYPDGSERYGAEHPFVIAGAVEAGSRVWPGGWPGATFDKPIKMWACEKTGEAVRDNPQRLLIGEPSLEEYWGSGAIPRDAIKETVPGRGVANGLDSVVVRFGGGGDVQPGESILSFKSYDRGWKRLQGRTLDLVWCDEEPPEDEYNELRTRTQKGQRSTFTMITFTPLQGLSRVVMQFLGPMEIKAMKL